MDGLASFIVQAIEQRIIILSLKKWFQSQKRQNKKNNNLLPTFSRQRPYAQWTSKRQGRQLGSHDRLHWDSTHASSRANDLAEEIV